MVTGVDSFLLTEGPEGTFIGEVFGDQLDWDTTYQYHFSDSDGGADLAATLSGTFKTPVEQVSWDLDSATVELDDDGNWVVEAEGGEGQDVWIIIRDVGSFKLAEVTPGLFKITIPASEFDKGKEYDYWFSDEENREDMEPGLSGSLKTKEAGEDNGTNLGLYLCLGTIVVLILILIIVVVLIASRRGKGSKDGWDEE